MDQGLGVASGNALLGWIWDIKRYALHDGPGIRSTVFFKGCPLRCLWCCNPESQSFCTQICWIDRNCLGCNSCLQVCPVQAISVDERGERKIDRTLCTCCGDCASRCPGEALNLLGRQVTVDAVLREVRKDAVFFQRSGGGLTLSGGEPAAQPEFATELLHRYKVEEYGHTAIETCGYAGWPEMARMLEFTDLVLYDIKHMDSEQHRRLTGVENGLILENAIRIARAGKRLVIRVPLIPGYNDDEENVRASAEFARGLPGVEKVDILPYHRLGEPKYTRLGREYALQGILSPSPVRVEVARRLIEALGLQVRVGG